MKGELFAEVLFDFFGLAAIGWVIFHLVMVEIYGVFSICAPFGEAPFEIGILSVVVGIGVWRTILDVRGKK